MQFPDCFSGKHAALLYNRIHGTEQICYEESYLQRAVRFHLRNVDAKLGVDTRGKALASAIEKGIGANELRETGEAHLSLPTGKKPSGTTG
jgi:hypothetical protein